MVTDSTNQADDTTAFLRAARSGNLEKVIEYLDTDLDINTANSNGLNALHLASKDGHVEIVTELLKRGAKVDAATKKGNTALHIASLAGQAEIVSILIQYGSAVNIQSQNGFTPLYMAAQENHDQVVKLLLSNGANQSLATEDGFTPLAVAMQQGHDKVVSVLLENDSKGKVRLPALHIAAKKDDCKAADLLLQNDHKPDVTSKSGFTPLHIAAHYGNEEIARLLIKRGADVNYLAKHNISPLHVAAKWGKNNMVKILLENSAQIDAKTRDGLTPLHCAARSGHEEVVNTLLENSAPISARTKNGLAPLHMASQGDHVDAARALLYHRAPVDEVTIDYLTSLHVAAHCGHVRVAKLLLDRKADPNARALNGFTPLHIACKKNRIKVVELLLKHGASIESTTESGLTPLHVASFMGCMNIVIFLLQHEANPDVPTVRGETPLHLAARANQTDIIRILLRNGAKVDARAREQQTPLHIASRLGNIDIVMLLLQHGAAVDTTTKDMHTALHIAAKEGQEEVAAILVENNASVKATTKNGFTPLHIAAKYGNMNVAKILLQKDSKLDAQGKNDITPLHLACHYDHPNVANLLLEKGASPHLASQNGHTPLHIAARKNQMDIASTLLEGGANANAESKAGFTPLHLSSQKGHYDMTNLLIEHGADPNHKAKNGLTALHLCAQEDFVRVASILVKNDANVESQTETGYRPIHVAAHFGNLSMIRFLLKHNAEIDVRTAQNYTPLHQAAQQGHAHVVSALLEGNASHKARTNDGLTALNIAQKLGYISVMEVLKGMPYDNLAPDNKNWEEKYKVIAPESLQETSLMSDSDDEGASDALISEQPYKYLTADLMKSLRDDSLPIDVTKDDPIHRQVTKEEKQEFTQSNNYCLAENFDSNDTLNLGFLVSFLVDARGGAMKGCRHSGVRIIVPPRRATMPLRVTCRLVKPSKVANPPPLMEGEALATRIIEMGPVGATFLGPVLIDIPHFASIRGKEREIIILKSENGETWKEHDNSVDNDDTLLNTPHDPQMNAAHSGRITRIITTDFPQYFAIVTRIKQEVHVIGAEGGILMSSVANDVQAVFPPGALTKKIKVGLQAHVIPAELTAKLLGNCVAVSPVITIEPRRRKFHKPITLTIPVPQAANKGMINQYGGETPTLRLLCSIAGGTSEAQWEDVTGSTPLTFMNDRVSFTTTVSARFWLMDCRNISEVPKMATELYKESLFIPYITNFVIYSKRMDTLEATLRILCMTDGKEGMHTLERQEEFLEIVKSRDVEALHGKDLYIEFSGNLIPVTKSGVQLKFTFKAFRQNRLSFHVKVKDPLLDPVARMLFMREPKVAKGEPPQQPICVLNIVLPEVTSKIEIQKKLTATYEDSNIINQKMDFYKSKYGMEQKEKGDQPKDTSPSEEKFIADTLQKEQTDAATIHESFAQKAACPLESVDASYPNKIAGQQEHDLSPSVEKQTYSEKRKFWEDISKKRESYQRSESEVSRTSQLTVNESDSEYMQNVVSEEEITEVTSVGSDTMENVNIPDISECSVAEKAHYFEEQIQKELSKVPAKLQQQDIVKPEKDKSVKIQRVEKPIDVAQVETTRDVEHEGKELKSSHVEEKDKDESDKLRKEDFKDEEITYKERVDKFHRKEYRETSVVGMEKMIELDREVKDMMDKKEDEKKEFELKKKKEEKGIKKKASELKKKLEEEEVKRKEIELQKKQEAELKKKQEEEEAKKKETELKKTQEEEEAKRKEVELKKKQKEEEEAKRKEAELKKKQEEEEAKRKEAELKKKQEEEEAKRKEAELKKKQEEEEAKRKEAELKKKQEEEEAKRKEAELKKKQEEEEAKRKEAELKKKQEEEAKRKEAELKKKQEEEEAKRKEAELKKKQEEEEAKRKEAELKKKQEEEEAKRKEAELKKKQEEEEAKRKEAELKKKQEEEEAKRKEAELKKKQEEEEAKRKEAELKKKQEEEEAKRKEAELKKKQEEEEAKRKEAELKKKQEEEEAKRKEAELKKKQEEEEAKRKEAELKKKQEEEEAKRKEAELKKKQEEEEAKRKEAELKKKQEEEEAKRKEAELKKKQEEEEAKRKEAELKKKQEEEEAKRKEAELKKKQEEEEAKRKEAELKKKQEEEEAKRKEAELKKKQEEEEAKRKEAELKKKQEEEEAKRKEAELKKKQEEEEAKRKEAELKKKQEEEEAKRKEAELKKKQEEEEAKRKEAELKKKQEEEEAKRKEEEEKAKKKKEEEEAKKKEVELKKKKEEEEVKRKEAELKKKQEEEEAKRRNEEEEAKKKKQEEEEEARRKKEEEEIKRKEAELKKKQEEETAKRKKEEEEEAKKKKQEEEETRRKKEEEEIKRKEAELKKKQEEEEAKRKKEEEEAKKKKQKEEETRRKKEEEDIKRKEAELKKKQEEEEAKRKKEEEEAKRRKEEEEAKRKEAELKKEQEEEIAKRKETELKKKQEVEVKEEVRKSKRKEEMELEKEAYEELEKHIEKAALVQILPEQLERSIEEAREIHHKELPEHIDRIVEKHELELQKEYLIERGESPKHTMEVASKESEFIHSKQAEHKEDISMQEKGLGKDISTGRRVIKEETTIIWKVQEDGSLVQEKVTKTVQIEGDEDVPVTTEIINVPETSLEPKVLYEEHYTVGDLEEKLKEDTKIEISKKDQVTEFIPEVQKEKIEDLGKEKSEEDKISPQKSTIESDSKLMKKEFESRIPISMAKVEKDRNHKESSRSKISIESKRLLEKSEIDKSSIPQEEFSITSPVDKKKEFESRIPKRIIDTSATKSSEKDIKKGYHVKTETETCTVTEKKSSSQETTSKSETQTFSKTFTDPNKAFKLLEDMSEKDTIKLSKVDHKASSKLEKKEVVSSEISKGTDKYIVHEEKEQIESKKLSESKMKKESSTETVEKEESKSKKIDETAVQKMSINLQDGQETIDASASKSRVEAKKEQLSKKLEDKEGIMTEESGVNRLKESDIEIAIKISKEDEKKKVEDTGEPPITSKIFEDLGKVEMVTKGESHKETVESFDARHFIPTSKVDEKLASVKKDEKPEEKVLTHETLEERQRRAAKEIEARQIVECLIESIESEITKRSPITEDPRAEIIDSNYLQQLVKESVETDHEKLADDLTKKFESIMKKTMEKQLVESTKDTDSTAESVKRKSSIHEEEKRSTRDSMSISEDITKDEESSLHDRDESLLLSSSQARLPERDITMSPSSISDQIELEETMDVDTNELEDITKPTSSPQSEKLHSDRSSAQAESLQRESYEPQYDISLPKDRIIYDVSGARVLEIVEPGIDSQSRQDSVDVPSLEMDEYKISEDTGKTISSLHESAAVDSLERIAQERDMTFSPSTVSEDINVDYSLVHEQVPTTTTEKYEVSVKRADSFEIESPPLVSPRLKIRHDLEIKPVNWMIGDEKIEISETLQPSQVFNQELEEYETTIRKQRLSSQSESADLEQESATKSSEDPSVIESIKESVTTGDTTVTTVIKTKKFIVIPVSDQDIESELIENKLEVSCQELVDTLKREYEAKTPTEDLTTISIRRPLSLEEAKIKLSEMKLADSSKIETTTDQHEISIDKESIDIAKEITSVSEEKLEAKEEVTSQIGKDEEIDGESLTEKHEEVIVKDITIEKIGLSLEEIAEPLKEDVKLLEDIETQDIAAGGALEDDPNKAVHVDDLAKEWMEPSLTKIKVSSDDYKRHVEKGFEKRDKAAKVSTVTSSDTCAFKIKKDDLPGVDLSARYAITVLDQVVKKEIAEVKESLEAARQDLIEELSENSETVIQIKDSPSEFQFKLQPESIPNDLPFLYRPPSLEQIAVDIEVTSKTESLIASEEKPDESKRDEKEIPATESGSEEIELEASGDEMDKEKVCMDIEMELDKSETETLSAVHEESKEDDDTRPSPVPASRSCSDVEYKDESSSSLHPPQPVPRRRHKPARASKKVTSESEVDPGSSSGESSNYQSCDYEIGSGSRPSSSDVEALQSATMPPSGTTSEYETAMMSVEHSATSRPTSQEYQTAVSTLSSRESMKSLSSFSSGHLGSIDSTSELSETLVASEPDADKGEEHEDLERAFDEEHAESDSSGSDIPMDDAMDKIDSNIPCRMKRSSEMIFQQIIDDNAALDTDLDEPILEQDTKGVDFATSAFVVTPGAVQSVDIMTARVTEDGVQSVSTQVISTQVTTSTTEIPIEETTLKTTMGIEIEDKPSDESLEMLSMEPDSLEPKSGISGTPDESAETVMQMSAHSMIQQASMSTSSTSGLSLDTVIEKAKSERSESPGSDSFELVDKPDIIDDFVVIEEVGREAEEFDSEGKSIRITAIPQVSSKQYDRDLENLITENKEDSQVSTSQTSRNNELFDFESEESPPQASNDDQYSQSYSDEEPYETGKKWIEMQFHTDARVYDIEYDRGPLEDIKEEEITDFEAGSSRFGSLGSHKESIGSVGSMRGSFGSTPDYDVLAGKKYFTKPSDHDTVSLSSLQEFEHLESAVAAENSKRLQCGSQDSINNGSLPRRYMTGRSGHGDDISLSSLKDFEGLERACREAHLIELRAREEEDLLEHESPENRYKMESLQRKSEISAAGSINPSTSGSDDYEKRIKEIDEIIRIAQSNVERLDRQDDTTEDISQIEITDIEKTGSEAIVPVVTEAEDIQRAKDTNIMETSTDSLELEDNADKKHPLCQSSDSLEMKTTLDFPSLSSDSLNNVRDARDVQLDVVEQFSNGRRMSSDSLDVPIIGQPDNDIQEESNNHSGRPAVDNSVGQSSSTETNIAKQDTTKLPSSSKT